MCSTVKIGPDLQAEVEQLLWVRCEAQAKEKDARLHSELAMRSANASQHQLHETSLELQLLQQQQQRFLVRY